MPLPAAALAPAYSIAQWVALYATLLGSMLAGATVVHVALAPDLTLRRPPAPGSNCCRSRPP